MQSISNIAFKEWGLVCAALATGEQIILLRKGGLDEGRDGFRVKHAEFWLLPTRFHQEASQLTPDAEPLWRDVQQHQPPVGKFLVDLYAVVQKVFEIKDLNVLERLAGEHILSKQTAEQRFHYRHPGLFVLAVRVYRVPQPREVADSPYIAGCKSWVEMSEPLSTAGSAAVLDDATFAGRMTSIERLAGTMR